MNLGGIAGVFMKNRVLSLPMSGTIHSTLGRFRLTRLRGVVAAVAIAMVVAAAIEFRMWRELGRAHSQLRAQDPAQFTRARSVEQGIEKMNAALLRFELSNSQQDAQIFQTEAQTVQGILDGAEGQPELRRSFDKYLADAAALMARPLGAVRKDSAARVQEQIEQISSALLEAAGKWASAQEEALKSSVATSASAVLAGRRLIEASGILVLVLVTGALIAI